MHPSAPIPRLKRRARLRARETGRPLHAELDRIAATEGFRSWSHLSAVAAAGTRETAPQAPCAATLLDSLRAGDLALIGARPRQGKTMLGMALAARAGLRGRAGHVFTLHEHARAVGERLAGLGLPQPGEATAVAVDASDAVSGPHVVQRLSATDRPALAVIDYLQILDQRRDGPSLQAQMETLRAHAKRSGAILAALAQIDRSFELSGRASPGLEDVRRPNPLDLSLFDVACFVHDGVMRIERRA